MPAVPAEPRRRAGRGAVQVRGRAARGTLRWVAGSRRPEDRGHLRLLAASRFDLGYGLGGLAHEALMTNIGRYGTQVIPRVRELLAQEAAPSVNGR